MERAHKEHAIQREIHQQGFMMMMMMMVMVTGAKAPTSSPFTPLNAVFTPTKSATNGSIAT
eukprot:7115517-Ditylum_brightwellii.AAC.1